MKRIVLSLFLIISLNSFAQRTVYHNNPDKYFNQGKEFFMEGNYAAAQDILSLYLKEPLVITYQEEAEYMLAASSFHRGLETAGVDLKAFLDRYPESIHRHQIMFYIGSYHFDKKEWKLAKFWFEKSNLDYLSPSEQEDYSFRMAYTNLQLENTDEADRLFNLLYQNSKRYRSAANFYLGYMAYKKGDFQNALSRFNSLVNDPVYREDASFYAAQSTFFKGDLDAAVNMSKDFLRNFPKSEHSTEINRIIGNSYYRMGQPQMALAFYRPYFDKTDKPLRGDAYFRGLSYEEMGDMNNAIKMFQYSIGIEDALSQNAQLHLGQAYLKTGEKQKAQMAFEAASRMSFDRKVRETALFNYALLVHQTNFSVFSESISLFEKFLQDYPNSTYTDQVNDILAETFLVTKDYNAALSAINRIKNPGRRILEAKQMILFQLGAQKFIDGRLNDAIAYFNDCIGMGQYDNQARSNAFYWRGETNYRIANYDKAENDFQLFMQSADKNNENYELGWYNVGYAQFKQQKYTQALNSFQQYISAENNKNKMEYADALNRVGDGYYFNRDFAQAERYYAQAMNANSEVADYSMFQQAFVMGLQRNFEGKIATLDNMMRRFPSSNYFDDALYEKSRALSLLGREQEAINVLNQLITNYPQSSIASEAGIQLGQLYFNIEDYNRSIDAYKQVIKNFPGTGYARTALVSLETVYREMNDISSYVNYTNTLPSDMRISPNRQDSLTYLAAEGVYMKGSKNEAESAMTRYLQNYPNGVYSSDANYYLAILADKKNNTAQAKSYFRKVAESENPKYADEALLYLAADAYNTQNYREALNYYTKLANISRTSTNKSVGLLGRARSLYALNNYNEVIRPVVDLLSIANLSPEVKAEAQYLRAKAYLQTKDADKAMTDLQSLSKETRSVFGAEAQFLLADRYYRFKMYDKAEAQVKNFMQKGTPHSYWLARALIVLSDTYAAKGDNFQARQYLQSLKSNYNGKEKDIQQMINDRLDRLK